MTPDALRDALIAAVASAVLFAAVRALRRNVPGGRDDSNSTNSLVYDSATVAVVVFIVVLALVPLYSSIGRDEVLPPPFGPVSTFST